MTAHPQTPSQTVGPFFHDALLHDDRTALDEEGVAGTPIVVRGRVVDGAGAAVTDAMVEIWQADGEGRYRHPADPRSGGVPGAFLGFGRCGTDGDGMYRIRTVMPGPVPGPEGATQAPHLNVHLLARGPLDQVWTRMYLGDELPGPGDPVLDRVPQARRHTLLARPEGDEEGRVRYRFDIVLQGGAETVFFAG